MKKSYAILGGVVLCAALLLTVLVVQGTGEGTSSAFQKVTSLNQQSMKGKTVSQSSSTPTDLKRQERIKAKIAEKLAAKSTPAGLLRRKKALEASLTKETDPKKVEGMKLQLEVVNSLLESKK